MRFRDSSMSGALALAGAVVGAACATSGAGNEHGPVFSDASTGDSATSEGGGADALPESTAKDASDASTDAPPGDAPETSAEAGGDAPFDAPAEAESEAASEAGEAGEATAPCTSTMALLAAGTSSTAVAIYGTDDEFYHGTYSSSWNAANDAVGSPQSFGPSGPSATGIGSDVLVAQSGQDGTLYDQTWSGTWGAASSHTGTLVEPSISPAVVALTGTGPDAMIVFVSAADAGSYYLQYTVRTSGSWSAPAYVFDQTGHVAYTSTTPSLAALPGGGAILAWWGSSPAYAYESTYGASGWTSPIAVSADTIQSPPSVAAGVCGSDAVAAYVTTAGTVSVATLTGGTWTTPIPIADASGMQTVAIATTP
jgi:hypothetical protein